MTTDERNRHKARNGQLTLRDQERQGAARLHVHGTAQSKGTLPPVEIGLGNARGWDHVRVLLSYGVPVAAWVDGETGAVWCPDSAFSATSKRHVYAWARTYGVDKSELTAVTVDGLGALIAAALLRGMGR